MRPLRCPKETGTIEADGPAPKKRELSFVTVMLNEKNGKPKLVVL
jgi:hypothetical protein